MYKRFSQLNQEEVGQNKNAKLSQDDILSLPELKVVLMLNGSLNTVMVLNFRTGRSEPTV